MSRSFALAATPACKENPATFPTWVVKGSSMGMGEPGLADQMRGQHAIDDAQHMAHDFGTAGEQEAQGKGEAQHP